MPKKVYMGCSWRIKDPLNKVVVGKVYIEKGCRKGASNKRTNCYEHVNIYM